MGVQVRTIKISFDDSVSLTPIIKKKKKKQRRTEDRGGNNLDYSIQQKKSCYPLAEDSLILAPILRLKTKFVIRTHLFNFLSRTDDNTFRG